MAEKILYSSFVLKISLVQANKKVLRKPPQVIYAKRSVQSPHRPNILAQALLHGTKFFAYIAEATVQRLDPLWHIQIK